MKIALYLLGVQGLIGAFDTIYYHEWKARLPARGRRAARELALHAARDFLYGVLFISLPRFAWKGKWIALLLGVSDPQMGARRSQRDGCGGRFVRAEGSLCSPATSGGGWPWRLGDVETRIRWPGKP